MMASLVFVFAVSCLADVSQLREEAPKFPPALKIPENKEKQVGTPPGAKSMDTLLERFAKNNPKFSFHEANSSYYILYGNTKKERPENQVRNATRGLPIEVLKDNTLMDNMLDSDLINHLLESKFPAYKTAAETAAENTSDVLDQSKEWNGLFYTDFPSPSQQERKGGPTGQLEGISKELNRNLVGLSEEDATPYYINVAPKGPMDRPTRHYLKRKEVLKLFKWVVSQLDVMRATMVDHFAATDPLMTQLAAFIDDTNAAGVEIDESTTDVYSDSFKMMQHGRQLVNDRLENAQYALPNQTDRRWVEKLKDEVQALNKTTYGNLMQVETELRGPVNGIGAKLGVMNKVYGTYQNEITERLAAWARQYNGQVNGVVTRIEQQLDNTHTDLGEFQHTFQMKEMRDQVDWFKNFMHSYKAVTQRSTFLNAATHMLQKSIDKMRSKLTSTAGTFADRLDSWKKNQKRLVGAFDTHVSNFERKSSSDSLKDVMSGANFAESSASRQLRLLKARSKSEIAGAQQSLDQGVDSQALWQDVANAQRKLKANVSSNAHALALLPGIDSLQREINTWPDQVTEFKKDMQKKIFQPSLNQMSETLRSSREGWEVTAAAVHQDELSNINSLASVVTDHIRNVSDAVQQAYHLSSLTNTEMKLKDAEDQLAATKYDIPSLDDLWDGVRAAQDGVSNLRSKGQQLWSEGMMLEKTSIDIKKDSGGASVQAAGKQILEEWNEMSKASLKDFDNALSQVTLPKIARPQPLSLSEIVPSQNIAPMYANLQGAVDLTKHVPEDMRESATDMRHVLEKSTVDGLKKACNDFTTYVRHAVSLDHLPKELDAAKVWVQQARMHLPSAGTQPALIETEKALDRLEKAYSPSSETEDSVEETTEDGVSDLKRGLVLADRTIAERGLNNAKNLNDLEKSVHHWAEDLPTVPPLTNLLAPRDVRARSPLPNLPTAAQLGLQDADPEKLSSDIKTLMGDASLDHAKELSHLLEVAEKANVIGADAAVSSNAGDAMLESATTNGRSDFPIPARRETVLTAINDAGDGIADATQFVKDLMPTKQLQKAMLSVGLKAIQLPELGAGDQILSNLREAAQSESISAAASKQEEDLDRIEESLRPILDSQVAEEIRQETAEPPATEPVLVDLGRDAQRVATELNKRIQEMHGEATQGFDRTEQNSETSNEHLTKAISDQSNRVKVVVDAMLERANSLSSSYTTIEKQESEEDSFDESIRKDLEAELDAMPTITGMKKNSA